MSGYKCNSDSLCLLNLFALPAQVNNIGICVVLLLLAILCFIFNDEFNILMIVCNSM